MSGGAGLALHACYVGEKNKRNWLAWIELYWIGWVGGTDGWTDGLTDRVELMTYRGG